MSQSSSWLVNLVVWTVLIWAIILLVADWQVVLLVVGFVAVGWFFSSPWKQD